MTVTQMPQTQHHSTTNVCVVLESETFSRVLCVREICKAFLERSYERIHHEFKQLNQTQGGKSSKEGLLATIMYPDAQNGNQGGQCKKSRSWAFHRSEGNHAELTYKAPGSARDDYLSSISRKEENSDE